LGKYKNRLIILLDISRLLQGGSLRAKKAAEAKAANGADTRGAAAGK
jgi:hypothetical protein